MQRWSVSGVARGLQLWLALGVCLSVGALAWFGYRAMQEGRRSVALLASRRTEETADLFVRALARDMHAVQNSVLISANWDVSSLDSPYDLRSIAAIAFARYPYPESFFAARQLSDPLKVTFFNRTARPPVWLRRAVDVTGFPVTITSDPATTKLIIDRIKLDADLGRRFSLFEIPVANTVYQIAARLLYADPLRSQFAGMFGFMVNLEWARRQYFKDLTQQVANAGDVRERFALRVLDDARNVIASSGSLSDAQTRTQRTFPLTFFEPALVALNPSPNLPWRNWTVEVQGTSEPGGSISGWGTTRTWTISTLSAVTLAFGLILTARATRTHAQLSEMRTEFVSSVTHELKTPIATIRAAGDTLVMGRFTRADAPRHYAQLIVQESKRLARLIDNLLAYARITDVTEAYWFEPLSLSELVSDAVQRFDAQLVDSNYEVVTSVPADLPPVWADRVAVELLLDNLIDNAIRYSGDEHFLSIDVGREASTVVVAISDRGRGIPADELQNVTRRFYRGRRTGSTGSGLGLAIAARIVRDHGGDLRITSKVRQGTTVSLCFRVAQA